MSDFNSLDLEHKRQFLFNCGLLNQMIEALQGITGMSRDALMIKASLIVKEKVESLTEEEVNEFVQHMQSMFDEHSILEK